MRIFIFGILLTLVSTSICEAAAGVRKIAEKTIYQYGGPETRTRCIREAWTKGFKCTKLKCRSVKWSTCREWATDFRQHGFSIALYGPINVTPKLLSVAKDVCFGTAIGVEAWGGIAVDAIPTVFASRQPAMEETLRDCVGAINTTLTPLTLGLFKVELQRISHW